MKICETHVAACCCVGLYPSPLLIVAVMGLAFAAPASAAEGDALNVVLTQTFFRDDNLFRLENGQRPVIDGRSESRGDVVSATSAGVLFDRSYGRQHISAEFGVTRNDYERFDHLDFTSKDGAAVWKWALGSQWSGSVSARRDESLRNFSDLGTTERSVNTYRRYAFDADYLFHPRWSAGAGVATASSRYDDARSAASEFTEDAVEARATFQPGAANRISLVGRAAEGKYPERTPASSLVTKYHQRDMQLRGTWAPTGQSSLAGQVGYTWREYPNLSEKNFSGVTGRLAWQWQPTGKFSLGVTARRELGAREDVVDNFVVTRAVAIEPAWAFSAKVMVRGRLEWMARDYGGTPFASTAADRDDKTRIASLTASWKPLRSLELSVGARREVRSSSGGVAGYSSESVVLAARCLF